MIDCAGRISHNAHVLFRQLSDGPCKTYLIASHKTSEALLIDPLLQNVETYLAMLHSKGLKLSGLLDTHTHADHLSACAELRDRTGAPYLMHRAAAAPCVTRRIEDGETMGFGEESLRFLHTPGHTGDSLTVVFADKVLSGDFLFIGSFGAGRLDLLGSDPGVHYESLKKIDALKDDLLLYPAHDYQGQTHSTLGAERKVNPILAPKPREAYIQWWLERKFGPADWMNEVVKANAACTRDLRAVAIPKEQAACACASGATESAAIFPQISPNELARRLRHAPHDLLLLDVRTPEEYREDGHIEGTVLIPVDELAHRVKEVSPGAAVVSICRSGKRATRAAGLLKEAGCQKIWVLTGGMLAWNQERLPVA